MPCGLFEWQVPTEYVILQMLTLDFKPYKCYCGLCNRHSLHICGVSNLVVWLWIWTILIKLTFWKILNSKSPWGWQLSNVTSYGLIFLTSDKKKTECIAFNFIFHPLIRLSKYPLTNTKKLSGRLFKLVWCCWRSFLIN